MTTELKVAGSIAKLAFRCVLLKLFHAAIMLKLEGNPVSKRFPRRQGFDDFA